MSDGIHGNRFFGFRTPAWHNLGFISQVAMSAVDALRTGLKGAYWYDKRPVTLMLNGAMRETGQYGIVRSAVPDDPRELVIGYVTDRYDIIQPLEIAEMFDENVNQPVETMGLLFEGSKLFLSWKLNQFELFTGDQIDCHGLLVCGYDGLAGTTLHTVYQRVVCANTLSMALHEGKSGNGKGKLFSGRHISPNLRRDLAAWMEFVQSRALTDVSFQQAQMNALAKSPVTDQLARDFFAKVFPYPAEVNPNQPEVIKVERNTAWEEKKDKADSYRSLAMELFQGAGTAIDATKWGLFNAVTETMDWAVMTKKPADQSILIGDRAKVKSDAWNIINNL